VTEKLFHVEYDDGDEDMDGREVAEAIELAAAVWFLGETYTSLLEARPLSKGSSIGNWGGEVEVGIGFGSLIAT